MNDMSMVIIPKSDQINADDLIAGPITITITDVQIRGGEEQPVSIYFAGSKKAFRPCKSMSRVLVAAWGKDAKVYVGRSLTLYRDPGVKWGGMEVGGIRISHMTDITAKIVIALTATKGQRKPHVVMPLVMSSAKTTTVTAADRAAQRRAEIDALPDAAAVAEWLMDNAALRDHANAQARDVYAYAEERGRTLAADAGAHETDGDESGATDADTDIPQDF